MALHRGGGRRSRYVMSRVFFFFQAEDGIRDLTVTGVQTCALPIFATEAELKRFELEIMPLYWHQNFKEEALRKMFDNPLINMDIASYMMGTLSRSEEHTSELQSQSNLVCRLLLEKKKTTTTTCHT